MNIEIYTLEEIKNRLSKGKTFREVEHIAENLVYEIIPSSKESALRARFDLIHREDLEKLGYKVIFIQTKKWDDYLLFCKLLQEKFGFIKEAGKVFLNKKINLVCLVTYEYYEPIFDITQKDKYFELVTLEQYIDLVSNKIYDRYLKWLELKNFVENLITEEREFYEKQIEVRKKNEIIMKALREAKAKGLI